MRRFLRGTGWTFIGLGCFVLYFLVYQLVGTNATASKEQGSLRRELESTWTAQAGVPAGRPQATKPRSIPVGKGVALLQIPRIKVEQVVVQGVEKADLRKGPGHVPSTVMPGQAGTFAVSGHRTTYGAPFFRLNELAKGDVMTVVTKESVFTYQVTSKKLVLPDDVSVLDSVRGPGGKIEPTITLTTCHPRFSAKQRLIVFGVLVATVPNNGTVAA
ncbi:MAG TPA: class E sortase [Actinomycetes bacterium]|jgi:sortase A|nr:class E sortase [Actinomycetes bacterium]